MSDGLLLTHNRNGNNGKIGKLTHRFLLSIVFSSCLKKVCSGIQYGSGSFAKMMWGELLSFLCYYPAFVSLHLSFPLTLRCSPLAAISSIAQIFDTAPSLTQGQIKYSARCSKKDQHEVRLPIFMSYGLSNALVLSVLRPLSLPVLHGLHCIAAQRHNCELQSRHLTHKHTHSLTHSLTHTRTHAHAHIHTHTYIHTHTQTHPHTLTHANNCFCAKGRHTSTRFCCTHQPFLSSFCLQRRKACTNACLLVGPIFFPILMFALQAATNVLFLGRDEFRVGHQCVLCVVCPC